MRSRVHLENGNLMSALLLGCLWDMTLDSSFPHVIPDSEIDCNGKCRVAHQQSHESRLISLVRIWIEDFLAFIEMTCFVWFMRSFRGSPSMFFNFVWSTRKPLSFKTTYQFHYNPRLIPGQNSHLQQSWIFVCSSQKHLRLHSIKWALLLWPERATFNKRRISKSSNGPMINAGMSTLQTSIFEWD